MTDMDIDDPIMQRALDALARADAALAEPHPMREPEPVYDWSQWPSTAGMPSEVFAAYCRAGKPPLGRPPAPPKMRGGPSVERRFDAMEEAIGRVIAIERRRADDAIAAAKAELRRELAEALAPHIARLDENIAELRQQVVADTGALLDGVGPGGGLAEPVDERGRAASPVPPPSRAPRD